MKKTVSRIWALDSRVDLKCADERVAIEAADKFRSFLAGDNCHDKFKAPVVRVLKYREKGRAKIEKTSKLKTPIYLERSRIGKREVLLIHIALFDMKKSSTVSVTSGIHTYVVPEERYIDLLDPEFEDFYAMHRKHEEKKKDKAEGVIRIKLDSETEEH